MLDVRCREVLNYALAIVPMKMQYLVSSFFLSSLAEVFPLKDSLLAVDL